MEFRLFRLDCAIVRHPMHLPVWLGLSEAKTSISSIQFWIRRNRIEVNQTQSLADSHICACTGCIAGIDTASLIVSRINYFCKSLFGKLLVIHGLGINQTLYNLYYSKYNHPCLSGAVDFDISHTENYVGCPISNSSKVGIDIEKNPTNRIR